MAYDNVEVKEKIAHQEVLHGIILGVRCELENRGACLKNLISWEEIFNFENFILKKSFWFLIFESSKILLKFEKNPKIIRN